MDTELHRLKQEYRERDSSELYDVVENARSLVEMRYGRYRGVFEYRSGISPTDSDKQAIRRRVAAKSVMQERLQEVMA